MSVAELPKTEDAISDRPNSGPLLLDSLEIKNFRAFRHLTIEKLGRVNLITGKNNVGKTALLEAILLYMRRGEALGIWELLRHRHYLSDDDADALSGKLTGGVSERLIAGVLTLFTESDFRPEYLNSQSHKFISTLQIGKNKSGLQVKMNFLLNAPTKNKGETINFALTTDFSGYRDGLQKLSPAYSLQSVLQSPYLYSDTFPVSGDRQLRPPCLFISSGGIPETQQVALFKTIAATPLKEELLKSLQIIEPNLEQTDIGRIAERDAFVVRRRNETSPFPITLLGEGMSRLFSFALGMVNSQNGILLIDEFENGLHYSIQSEVWRFIFQLAQRLNVQIFATTHSWECIEAFQEAAEADDDPNSGALIRLQNKNGDVIAQSISEERLAIITRDEIEVR